MNYPGLRIAKDILLRIFAIGYVFLLLSWFLFMGFKAQWYDLLVAQWHISNADFLNLLTLSFFALAKFILWFYVLIPALAICWTLRKLEKKGP